MIGLVIVLSLLTSRSENFNQVLDLAKKAATSNVSILLLGETGTGKELLADFIHQNSNRAEAPLVKLNCAAVHVETAESEIFGHEKGAFTGADKLKLGKIEYARNGTLFLDEIGDMPQVLQQKLLRVVENRTFTRLGGNEEIRTEARFISATNRNIQDDTIFRNDLYFRLAGVVLTLPPLRERIKDIVPLANFFIEQAQSKMTLSIAAQTMLIEHSWHGNIRELRHAIERALVVAEDVIEPEHLDLRTEAVRSFDDDLACIQHLRNLDLDTLERMAVIEALSRTGWEQQKAAKLLGISARTTNYKVKLHRITHSKWKTNV